MLTREIQVSRAMLGRNPGIKNKRWLDKDPERLGKSTCSSGHMLLDSQYDICGVEETEQESGPKSIRLRG